MVTHREAQQVDEYLRASKVVELSRVEVPLGAVAWQVVSSGCSLGVARLKDTPSAAIDQPPDQILSRLQLAQSDWRAI